MIDQQIVIAWITFGTIDAIVWMIGYSIQYEYRFELKDIPPAFFLIVVCAIFGPIVFLFRGYDAYIERGMPEYITPEDRPWRIVFLWIKSKILK